MGCQNRTCRIHIPHSLFRWDVTLWTHRIHMPSRLFVINWTIIHINENSIQNITSLEYNLGLVSKEILYQYIWRIYVFQSFYSTTYPSIHLHTVFICTKEVVGFVVIPVCVVSSSSINPLKGQWNTKIIHSNPEMGQRSCNSSWEVMTYFCKSVKCKEESLIHYRIRKVSAEYIDICSHLLLKFTQSFMIWKWSLGNVSMFGNATICDAVCWIIIG